MLTRKICCQTSGWCGRLGTGSTTLWHEWFVFTCSTPMLELSSLQDSSLNGAPAQLVMWLSLCPPLPSIPAASVRTFFRTAPVRWHFKTKLCFCDNDVLPLPLSSKGLSSVLRRFSLGASTSSWSNVSPRLFPVPPLFS
jgi:hypothetical protein